MPPRVILRARQDLHVRYAVQKSRFSSERRNIDIQRFRKTLLRDAALDRFHDHFVLLKYG